MVRTNNSECIEEKTFGISIADVMLSESLAGNTNGTERSTMELGTTILLSNGLMAAMIYIVVSWIWEE